MTSEQITDFVKMKKNSIALDAAKRQQRQLAYFTQSHIQEEITMEYLQQWANRQYAGTDYFLTWIKMIFREENFLSFYKYMRHPLPSARLVNDNIKIQLKRVFNSEDSYFRYVIGNKEVPTPEELEVQKYTDELFDSLLFRHNDIDFTDLKDINTPTRYFVNIENVVSIDSECNEIERIAFAASIEYAEQTVFGYLYADEERYVFYNREYEVLLDVLHDLGRCPADYITLEHFPYKWDNYYYKTDIVRKGIFSYQRESLEEYVFLKTLLKMVNANGAIPVAVKLKTNEVNVQGKDIKGASDKEPMSANSITSQKARVGKQVVGSNSILQAGTIVEVNPIPAADGSINMDAVKNFVSFHYVPTEALQYVKDTISEIEQDIIAAILGDYSEADSSAKNELQVSKSYISKEDKLRELSNNLSVIRTKSDKKFLSLKYGSKKIDVSCFFGSDFFIETQGDIFDKIVKSPNPIESRSLLIRLSRNRNMHNKVKADRERILYNLLPYATEKDFQTALGQQMVPDEVKALQTRFNYWIDLFEAQYGDVLTFWQSLEESDSSKIILITNLLNQLINESNAISTPPGIQGGKAVV